MHKARLLRSGLRPLVSGLAELGVLSVIVDRPRMLHARKRSPSVRLPRRFQFCKFGLISLRSLDRFTLAKRGKCAADIFTQGSDRPNRPYRPPQPSGLRHVRISHSATLRTLRVLRGGTPQFWCSRTSSSWPSLQLRDREASDLVNSDSLGTQEGNFVSARPPTS